MTPPLAPRLTLDTLPQTLPVFPLAGVILLPGGRIPLNVYEPRYVSMIEDALAAGRMIGLIQPNELHGGADAPLFQIGCAGRIVSFSETEDNRFLITLAGICRFAIQDEIKTIRGYRRIIPNWSDFQDDLIPEQLLHFDRARLMTALQRYFRQQSVAANWDAIEQTDDDRLITSLCMICPFEASEKQALLEAPTSFERAQMLITLIEMATLDKHDGDGAKH
jgi:uncharacterized protein